MGNGKSEIEKLNLEIKRAKKIKRNQRFCKAKTPSVYRLPFTVHFLSFLLYNHPKGLEVYANR